MSLDHQNQLCPRFGSLLWPLRPLKPRLKNQTRQFIAKCLGNPWKWKIWSMSNFIWSTQMTRTPKKVLLLGKSKNFTSKLFLKLFQMSSPKLYLKLSTELSPKLSPIKSFKLTQMTRKSKKYYGSVSSLF